MIRQLVAQCPKATNRVQVVKKTRHHGRVKWKLSGRCFSLHRNLQDERDKGPTKAASAKDHAPAAASRSDSFAGPDPMLAAADTRELRLLNHLPSLARWKSKVANKSTPTAEESLATRSILEKVLSHGVPATRRFAALYITKSALAIPPHGVKTLLAKRAIAIVQQLNQDEDPEAMILIGQLLESSPVGPETSQNLYQATQLYAAAVKLIDQVRWTNKPEEQIVVTPGEALFAFGSINVYSNTQSVREEAMQALERAVKDYNHFKACQYLEAQLPKYSAERYDCLLRLAVTGYWPAAKALGDIASAPYSEFDKYDLAVRQDLLGGDRWLKTTETLYQGEPKIVNSITDLLLSAVYEKTVLEARSWINGLASWPNQDGGKQMFIRPNMIKAREWYQEQASPGRPFNEAAEWAQSVHKVSEFITSYLVLARVREEKEKKGDEEVHDAAHRMRWFKAIDWYHLAAIGGHVPAMVAGCQWAIRTRLLWYVVLFHWHMEQLPRNVRLQYDSELNKMFVFEKQFPIMMEHIRKLTKEKMGEEFDMDKVSIWGHV